MSSFFGLFRGAAAAIGEAMAPLIRTNLEQLIATWRRIDAEYARMLQSKDDALDDSTLVEASRLSELLGQLINVLIVEENECQAAAVQAAVTAQAAAAGSSIAALSRTLEGGGSDEQQHAAAPCVEYFVRETLFDRLVALGLADRPPGMRRLIAKSLDALFTHLRRGQLLPHVSIRASLLQFLAAGVSRGDLQSKNKAARGAFVSLLRTLCWRLRDDPSLVGVFLREGVVENLATGQRALGGEFLPFTALLTLLNSEHEDGEAARDGLLCCLQLPVEGVSRFVVHHTLFCEQLVFGVRERFERLPRTLGMAGVQRDEENRLHPYNGAAQFAIDLLFSPLKNKKTISYH